MVAYFCYDKVAYFCFWQHFHDDGKKEENDGSIEVESAKEVNFLLKERENLERDYDQDTGERTCCSLDKGNVVENVNFAKKKLNFFLH